MAKPFSDAPRDAIKSEFARRLQAKMMEKSMRQSDLMRAMNVHLPKANHISRDSISKYLRAMNLPGPIYVTALAKALHCKAEELIPAAGLPQSAESLAFDMRQTTDGNVWLRINQAVPWATALKIAALLKSEAT